jgi:hypothetical protein
MSASPTPEGLPAAGPAVPCRHLRSKGMYVYTDGSNENRHDDYDNTIYWCLRSMKGFGPDDEMVDRESCCDAGRSCYQPL